MCQNVMQLKISLPLPVFSLFSVLFLCWFEEVDACVLAWPFSCLVSGTCSDHDEA